MVIFTLHILFGLKTKAITGIIQSWVEFNFLSYRKTWGIIWSKFLFSPQKSVLGTILSHNFPISISGIMSDFGQLQKNQTQMCKPDFNFFFTDMRFKTATGTFLGQCQYVVTNYQRNKLGVHGCAILCFGMGETLKYS